MKFYWKIHANALNLPHNRLPRSLSAPLFSHMQNVGFLMTQLICLFSFAYGQLNPESEVESGRNSKSSKIHGYHGCIMVVLIKNDDLI